jgi:hypothetical protein
MTTSVKTVLGIVSASLTLLTLAASPSLADTHNGIVVVTTHLYDGKKSLPLDIELYQHGSSLADLM